ncbi:MAG: imidazoleglycerol-phosphate dehydratase [archaeon]
MKRTTRETDIEIELCVYGTGKFDVQTPIGMFTHLMESFARHGMFDLKFRITGDLKVDQHHTMEDAGLVLGKEFRNKLDRSINRAGCFVFPMDEALSVVAVDIGGRPYLQYEAEYVRRYCGELDTDVLEDFFYGFSVGLGANVAVRVLSGRSDHHKIESMFKGFGKAMMMACGRIDGEIPSTKGVIDDNDY